MLLAISPSDTHTHSPASTAACFCQHCTMSRFWQLFWPALARKAGQRDPQTLVGGLGAHHGTSRSKSGKKFSPSAMTLGPKLHLLATSDIPAPTRRAYSAKSPQRAHPHLPGQCISEEPWRSHYIAICSEWVAKHSSKTRSRCQSEIRTIDSLRFTTLSCKRQKYYAKSRSCEEPWCSHYNAFSSISWQTRMSRHTWQQNVTTIM